jgi:hypothetical protein
MSKAIKINVPDFDYVDFEVKTSEGVRTFKLMYDYAAIKVAEDETGVDLRDVKEWASIKSSHLPALVHAGLHRNHPDVTLEQVGNFLHPSVQGAVLDAIFELLFPGVIEKTRELRAKEDARKNGQGDAANASVPASV